MRRSRSRKGVIFTLDAMFAMLAVLLIAYIGYSAFSITASRSLEMEKSNERYARLLLVSDYLVKSNATVSDSSRTYPHQIDMGKLRSLDTGELASRLGVESVKVSLLISKNRVFGKGSGSDCARRIVWVPEYSQVGYLETCIE